MHVTLIILVRGICVFSVFCQFNYWHMRLPFCFHRTMLELLSNSHLLNRKNHKGNYQKSLNIANQRQEYVLLEPKFEIIHNSAFLKFFENISNWRIKSRAEENQSWYTRFSNRIPRDCTPILDVWFCGWNRDRRLEYSQFQSDWEFLFQLTVDTDFPPEGRQLFWSGNDIFVISSIL